MIPTTESNLRKKILYVQELNMNAIVNKNNGITQTADKQSFAYITILGTFLFLISFTFHCQFSALDCQTQLQNSRRVSRKLPKRIIPQRIHIETKDEFGELASAFNTWLKNSDEYGNTAT